MALDVFRTFSAGVTLQYNIKSIYIILGKMCSKSLMLASLARAYSLLIPHFTEK